MTSSHISRAQLEQSRRDAQRLARSKNIPIHAAQDQIARDKGFQNWSIYAKQVRDPKAKPPAPKPVQQVRYYLHGDQHEKEPAHYYCKECDVFMGVDHFAEPHRQAHAERALHSIEFFYKPSSDFAQRASRALGSPNLFSAEMAELIAARKAREAMQSPFYQWLCKQDQRDDPVGDLAYDIKRDERFPVDASLRRSQSYLEHERWVSEAVLSALKVAWAEFSATKSRR